MFAMPEPGWRATSRTNNCANAARSKRRPSGKGDSAGQFAVDLEHPRRLVFEPAGDPAGYTEGGLVQAERVTAVRILEVVDYHD